MAILDEHFPQDPEKEAKAGQDKKLLPSHDVSFHSTLSFCIKFQ